MPDDHRATSGGPAERRAIQRKTGFGPLSTCRYVVSQSTIEPQTSKIIEIVGRVGRCRPSDAGQHGRIAWVGG